MINYVKPDMSWKEKFTTRECECYEYPGGIYCKICGGSGYIYTHKESGLEYSQHEERAAYLVPMKALTGPEKKYGANWNTHLELCPR